MSDDRYDLNLSPFFQKLTAPMFVHYAPCDRERARAMFKPEAWETLTAVEDNLVPRGKVICSPERLDGCQLRRLH